LKIIAGSTSADNFALQIQDYAGADKLVVLDNGRVGIGTTDPQVALDVTGDIRLSGRVRQGSLGDLAEMMVLSGSIVNPANIGLEASDVIANQKSKTEPVVLKGQEGYQDYLVQRPEAGDVVIIAIDGGIKRSHQAYATNTAGIISTNPAQILQDGLENSAPVALSGVVPCKVSAENGVIMPGDLLVASTLPGHAMKAGNAPPVGSIIGKALNRLEDAVGVVRVLVMMQ